MTKKIKNEEDIVLEFDLEKIAIIAVELKNFRGVGSEPFKIQFFPVVSVDDAQKLKRIRKKYLGDKRYNFMTYGGNGAGKSTIADALAFYFGVPIQRYGKRLKLEDLVHRKESRGYIKITTVNKDLNSKLEYFKRNKGYEINYDNFSENFEHFKNYMRDHIMLITYEILHNLISYTKSTEYFTLDFYLLNKMTTFYEAVKNLREFLDKLKYDLENNELEQTSVEEKFRELINKEGLYPDNERILIYHEFKNNPEEAKRILELFNKKLRDNDKRKSYVQNLIKLCSEFIELKNKHEIIGASIKINEEKIKKIYHEVVLPKVRKIEKEATRLLNKVEGLSGKGLEIKIEALDDTFAVFLLKNGNPIEVSKINEGLTTLMSICIYLAIAKDLEIKLLILDDILLSVFDYKLDIFNILNEEFKDSQIILFTHDRVFYNTIRNYVSIEGIKTWNFIKIFKKYDLITYCHENIGYDIYIDESIRLDERRTALFYIRLEFERVIRNTVKTLKLETKYGNHKLNHLLDVLIKHFDSNGNNELKNKLEKFRNMYNVGALNPAAHPDMGVDLYREEANPDKIWVELKELREALKK